MKWKRELISWAVAVFRELYGWLSGSAIAVMAGAGQQFGWWILKPRIYGGVVFIGFLASIFLAWRKEYRTAQAFIRPKFDLRVTGIGTLQRDSQLSPISWDAVYWRIAIQNESPITLNQCEVILESWTFTSIGLNSDTALTLKDQTGSAIDIPGKDRKQFNFLFNILHSGTQNLAEIRVHVPNITTVSSPPGGYSAVLRIIGGNMDTRRYNALLLIDAQGIRITTVDEVL